MLKVSTKSDLISVSTIHLIRFIFYVYPKICFGTVKFISWWMVRFVNRAVDGLVAML